MYLVQFPEELADGWRGGELDDSGVGNSGVSDSGRDSACRDCRGGSSGYHKLCLAPALFHTQHICSTIQQNLNYPHHLRLVLIHLDRNKAHFC